MSTITTTHPETVVCDAALLEPDLGVAALLNDGRQVAVFRLSTPDGDGGDRILAVGNIDPYTGAAGSAAASSATTTLAPWSPRRCSNSASTSTTAPPCRTTGFVFPSTPCASTTAGSSSPHDACAVGFRELGGDTPGPDTHFVP